jgi:protein ImuB
MRVVAVFVPHFAVVAHRRRDAGLRRRPVALLGEGRGGKPVVVACSPDALAKGILVGMAPAAAAAACDGAALVPFDVAYCRAEHARVRDALLGLTPEVEDESLGCWCFMTAGSTVLHGNETHLAGSARRSVLAAGYAARVAIAEGRFTTTTTARFGQRSTTVVRAGCEAAALARFSITALPLGEDVRRRLVLLGVRTVGDFARLPLASVRSRFGPAGEHAHRLANGLDPAPLVPRGAPVVAAVEEELEAPAAALDELLFLLHSLAERLLDGLAARGLACWEVRVDLDLADAAPVEIAFRLVRPTLAARVLWTLIRLRLERVVLQGPVRRLRLAAVDAPPATVEQQELFRVHRDSDRLEAALERLRARFGPEVTASPLFVDTHRPEARLVWGEYQLDGRPLVLPEATGRVLRIVSPPQPLASAERLGRLVSLSGFGVERLSEPHRLAGEWWGDEYTRDYHVVLTGDGRLLWVFREIGGGWFLQGEFD